MTTLNLPSSISIRTSNFGLQGNTQVHESPLSGETQRIENTGLRWFGTFTLSANNRAKMAEVQAFLVKLRGQYNSFYAYDPDAKTARGSAGTTPGTPLVNAGSQTGTSLNIDGATASATGYLLPGDYFTVNNELKMITEQIDTNGSGEATLVFEPPLRNSPSDNATITLATPKCIMMMIDDKQAQWDANQFGVYNITFSAIEVVNP